MRRQAGPVRPNLHPLLRPANAAAPPPKQPSVSLVTHRGKTVAAAARHMPQQREFLDELRAMVSEADELRSLLTEEVGGAEPAAAPSGGESAAGEAGTAAQQHAAAAGTAPPQQPQARQQQQQQRVRQQTQQEQQQEQPQPLDTSFQEDVHFIEMLALLQQWQRRFGSCIVPPGVYDKPALAEWVAGLRAAQDAKRLPSWQQRELAAMQPGWQWRVAPAEAEWHHHFHRVRHFKALHGHTHMAVAAGSGSSGSSGSGSDGGIGDASSSAGSSSGSSSSSASNGEEWADTAQWLAQQQQLHRTLRLPSSKAKRLRRLGEGGA